MSGAGTSNSGAFTVTWAGVAGATSYTLYESANGGAWTVVQVANVGSWSTSGRGNGTYVYSVYACNVGGCGPGSAGLTVTVALLPLTPTGLTLTQTGPFTKPILHLSWNASAYSTSYQLEYTNPPTFPTIVYNATGTAYSSLILTNGTVEYRVKGCNAVGCSAFSGYVLTQLLSGSCTGTGCSQ
jgi:hypothetical protein